MSDYLKTTGSVSLIFSDEWPPKNSGKYKLDNLRWVSSFKQQEMWAWSQMGDHLKTTGRVRSIFSDECSIEKKKQDVYDWYSQLSDHVKTAGNVMLISAEWPL